MKFGRMTPGLGRTHVPFPSQFKLIGNNRLCTTATCTQPSHGCVSSGSTKVAQPRWFNQGCPAPWTPRLLRLNPHGRSGRFGAVRGGRGEGGCVRRGHGSGGGACTGCSQPRARPHMRHVAIVYSQTRGLCAFVGRVGIRDGRRATGAIAFPGGEKSRSAQDLGVARAGRGEGCEERAGVWGRCSHVVQPTTGTAAHALCGERLLALQRALRVRWPSRHPRWATRDGRDCAYRGREKAFCTLGVGSCAGRGRQVRGLERVSAIGNVSVCKCFWARTYVSASCFCGTFPGCHVGPVRPRLVRVASCGEVGPSRNEGSSLGRRRCVIAII